LPACFTNPARRGATAALAAVALVAAVGATWTIIDVGHSGAKAVWHATPSAAP
jgi:hypothetical protein